MNLSRKIADALDALPDQTIFPHTIVAEKEGHSLTIDLVASGPIGLAFNRLEYQDSRTEPRSPEALRSWADNLSASLTYLMEPLVVIEHDTLAGEVELRSQSPTVRREQCSYYELHLAARGPLRLSRVVFDKVGRRRGPAPCQLTREVLERLADDLVASAS
ncbi:MAG: hypothetical protein NVSMB9_11810 [Isosphaeraceae bacterium]